MSMNQDEIDKLTQLGRVKFTGRSGNFPRMFTKDLIRLANDRGADKITLSDRQKKYLDKIYQEWVVSKR